MDPHDEIQDDEDDGREHPFDSNEILAWVLCDDSGPLSRALSRDPGWASAPCFSEQDVAANPVCLALIAESRSCLKEFLRDSDAALWRFENDATLLHVAAAWNLPWAVVPLLEAGASPTARTKGDPGRDALSIAACAGHLEFLDEILLHTANLRGQSPAQPVAWALSSLAEAEPDSELSGFIREATLRCVAAGFSVDRPGRASTIQVLARLSGKNGEPFHRLPGAREAASLALTNGSAKSAWAAAEAALAGGPAETCDPMLKIAASELDPALWSLALEFGSAPDEAQTRALARLAMESLALGRRPMGAGPDADPWAWLGELGSSIGCPVAANACAPWRAGDASKARRAAVSEQLSIWLATVEAAPRTRRTPAL